MYKCVNFKNLIYFGRIDIVFALICPKYQFCENRDFQSSPFDSFFTDGLEISCFGISKILHFLERILMEHIDMKNSLDSKLQFNTTCSIRIRSRNWDIVEKPLQHISNPFC